MKLQLTTLTRLLLFASLAPSITLAQEWTLTNPTGREYENEVVRLKVNLPDSAKQGDYVVRAIGSGLLSVLLIAAIYLTEDLLVRNLFGVEVGAAGWLIEMQIAFWIVAVYFAVVRYLTYLDSRIRNEGWEVELLLRAQRARLVRPVV